MATNLPHGWVFDKVFGAAAGMAAPGPPQSQFRRPPGQTCGLAGARRHLGAVAHLPGHSADPSGAGGLAGLPPSVPAGKRARRLMRRLGLAAAALVLSVGLWQLAAGLYIPAKAALAHYLIGRSWAGAACGPAGRPLALGRYPDAGEAFDTKAGGRALCPLWRQRPHPGFRSRPPGRHGGAGRSRRLGYRRPPGYPLAFPERPERPVTGSTSNVPTAPKFNSA